jgi:hypothetical protein
LPLGSGAFRCAGGAAQVRLTAQKKKAPALTTRASQTAKHQELLDLGFLKLDMLLSNRVILGLGHLVRHRAAVLRGDVEETRISRRQQLDLDGRSFCHGVLPLRKMKPRTRSVHGEIWREITNRARKVNCVLV